MSVPTSREAHVVRTAVMPTILDIAPLFVRRLRASNKAPRPLVYLEAVEDLGEFLGRPEPGLAPTGRVPQILRMRREPVLVVGAPRTGSTWVAQVLSHASGVSYISEPDNEWPNPFALKAKFGLGRFPVLEDGDRAPGDYEWLWERVFDGFQPSRFPQALARQLDRRERTMGELWHAMCAPRPRLSVRLRLLTSWAWPPSSRVDGRVLVKSVYAPLAVEWLGDRFRPAMVIVRRHPMNVVASWTELGWGGCALVNNPTVRRRFGERWGLPELGAETSALEQVSWEVGLFTSALEAAAERHPEWTVASHESLCREPTDGFHRLYDQLGFEWTDQTDRFLGLSNQPGVGYSTFRVASEQPERWRQRLTPEQVKEAWSVLSRFRAPWVNRIARDIE